jgi:hypothetical protein
MRAVCELEAARRVSASMGTSRLSWPFGRGRAITGRSLEPGKIRSSPRLVSL